MLIVQISDIHMAPPGQRTLGIAPMAEHLARCVAHINRLAPQPDLVLVTGDVTHNGHPEEAERAATILAALRMPFFVIPGNHDDRAVLAAAFGRVSCPLDARGFVNYVVEGYDLRLIAVDTVVPGAPGGAICAARAAWLAARLREERERPTLLFMHHPPVRFGVIETDIDGFAGADRLGELLAEHRHVIRILAGHIHLSSWTQWRGLVVSTAPSMGMRLFLDLTLQRSAFILDEPAYHLHHWTPDQRLVTHTVRVLAEEPLHPFTPP